MAGRIAIVTDSTASLPAAAVAGHAITVVPLQVVIGATSYDENSATTEMVASALHDFTPVSTSRPNPATFLEAYERLAADGVEEILSIHLSAEMSGTFESAQLAAKEAPVPVVCLDARQVGIATGYAVLAAAACVAGGGTVEDAAEAAVARSARTTSYLYVDTLEYLRRGGRVSTAAALFGSALAVKPLLQVLDGRIEALEKVRTAGKALARLEELAVLAADGEAVEVTVAHLDNPDRAQALAGKLQARLDVVGEVSCTELGAVLGAHVGPGMVAVCVTPALV